MNEALKDKKSLRGTIEASGEAVGSEVPGRSEAPGSEAPSNEGSEAPDDLKQSKRSKA